MAKNKNREKERQKRAEKRKQKRKGISSAPRAAEGVSDEFPEDLEPPEAQRCLPPIFVDRNRAIIPDPRSTLGLATNRTPTEAEVRDGWRKTLMDHPPEQDPEGARLAREARDRLLNPDYFLERELGVLHVPDPRQWPLPAPEPPRLDATRRLTAETLLYALVEDALWDQGLEEVMRHRG